MRRARPLSLMVALALLAGGAAACSDDDGDGDTASTEAPAGESSTNEGGGDDSGDDGGADTGNVDLDKYCDKVEELVEKTNELLDDPSNSELQTAVTDLSTETGELGIALAGQVATWTPEDTQKFQACQDELSKLNR